jgi:hypothetical protein
VIDLNEIQAGDLVIIQDSRGNVISGATVVTMLDGRPDGLAVQAFGFLVPFAKKDIHALHRGYDPISGVTLIEHQGSMVPNAELYMRSQAQLQRNKHLRSNPT